MADQPVGPRSHEALLDEVRRRAARRRRRRHGTVAASVAALVAAAIAVPLSVLSSPAPSTVKVIAPVNVTTTTTSLPTPTTAPAVTTAPVTTVEPTTQPTPPSSVSVPPSPIDTVTIGAWTGAKPQTIWFTGDAGNVVTNIIWSSWSADSGVGRGTWHDDNCVPDCAQGTVTDYPASITMSHPSAGQFTLLTEVQSGPHGQSSTFTLPDPGLGGASSTTVFDH